MSRPADPNIPVIVAGMHRSGTSMTASFMSALGVDFGDRLLPGDRHNAPGYFEDVDFLEFQREILRAGVPQDEPGWPDWGWTVGERLDTARFAEHTAQATALIATRAKLPLWGFKDPRSTLFLPFWRALMPQARYVLVYRFPWDVADSINRINIPIFEQRPDLTVRAWAYYNRQMLNFYEQHRDVAVLVSADAMVADLGRFAGLVVDKLGLPLSAEDAERRLSACHRPGLMHAMPHDAPLVALMRELDDEAIALLQALDAAADMPSGYAGEPAMTALQAGMTFYRAMRAEQRLNNDYTARLAKYPPAVRAILTMTPDKVTTRLKRIATRLRLGGAPKRAQ